MSHTFQAKNAVENQRHAIYYKYYSLLISRPTFLACWPQVRAECLATRRVPGPDITVCLLLQFEPSPSLFDCHHAVNQWIISASQRTFDLLHASTHSFRLVSNHPDTPNSLPTSPLSSTFRRPHTPLGVSRFKLSTPLLVCPLIHSVLCQMIKTLEAPTLNPRYII